MFEFFKRRRQIKANGLVREDLERFIRYLKGVEPTGLGQLVALSTRARLQLVSKGALKNEYFDVSTDPEIAAGAHVAMTLMGDLVRKFQADGNQLASTSATVWYLSLLAIAFPESRYLGQEMWHELSRGFPNALDQWYFLDDIGFPLSTAPDVEEFMFIPWPLRPHRQ